MYPPGTRCEWRLIVKPTATMTLTFLDMHLYGMTGRRCFDYINLTSMASHSLNETGVTECMVYYGPSPPRGGFNRPFGLSYYELRYAVQATTQPKMIRYRHVL